MVLKWYSSYSCAMTAGRSWVLPHEAEGLYWVLCVLCGVTLNAPVSSPTIPGLICSRHLCPNALMQRANFPLHNCVEVTNKFVYLNKCC